MFKFLLNLATKKEAITAVDKPLAPTPAADWDMTGLMTAPRSSRPSASTLPTQDDVDRAIARLYKNDDPELFAELAELALDSIPKLAASWQTREGAVTRQLPFIVETGNKAVDEACLKLLRSPEVREGFPHLLQAAYYGLVALEVIWAHDEKRGFYVDEVIPVPPKNLVFDAMTREPLMRPIERNGEPVALADYGAQFVVHRHRKSLSHPYRKGIAFKLLPYVVLAPHGMRLFAGLLERYGEPLRLGLLPDDASTPPDRLRKVQAMLAKALKNIGADGWGVLPRGTDIRFETAGNVTGAMHQAFNATLDEMTATLICGASLPVGNSAGGTNTNALGQVQDGVRNECTQADTDNLSLTLQRGFLRPFVEANFGPNVEVPTVYFSSEMSKDMTAWVSNVTALMAQGLEVSQRELREQLGLREPEPGEATAGGAAPDASPFAALSASKPASLSYSLSAPEGDEIDAIIASLDESELDSKLASIIEKAKTYEELKVALAAFVDGAAEAAPGMTEQAAVACTCCEAAGATGVKLGGE